jgi:hypothetical protein
MWLKDEERYSSRQTLIVYTNIKKIAEHYEHKANVVYDAADETVILKIHIVHLRTVRMTAK